MRVTRCAGRHPSTIVKVDLHYVVMAEIFDVAHHSWPRIVRGNNEMLRSYQHIDDSVMWFEERHNPNGGLGVTTMGNPGNKVRITNKRGDPR